MAAKTCPLCKGKPYTESAIVKAYERDRWKGQPRTVTSKQRRWRLTNVDWQGPRLVCPLYVDDCAFSEVDAVLQFLPGDGYGCTIEGAGPSNVLGESLWRETAQEAVEEARLVAIADRAAHIEAVAAMPIVPKALSDKLPLKEREADRRAREWEKKHPTRWKKSLKKNHRRRKHA